MKDLAMKDQMNAMVLKGLENRILRLKKLLALDAPLIVIFNEIMELHEQALLLGGGEFHANQLMNKAKEDFCRKKPTYGVCANEYCWNECFEECEIDGIMFCTTCHEKIATRNAAILKGFQ